MLRLFTCALFALVVLPGLSFAATIQAWLLVSADWSDSVISTDSNERDALLKDGWKLNGTGYLQNQTQKGAAPLHRLARIGAKATDRMLETNPAKIAAYVKEGFADEGVIGFASIEEGPGLMPVYRFTNDGRHLWLFDLKDQSSVEKHGWKAAGVSFWLWPLVSKGA